jgi:WD40 repeat protein
MGTIVATLSGASGDIVSVHGKEDAAEGGSIHIVTGSADGHVRLYKLMSDGKKKEMTSTLLGTAKLEAGVPVNVVLHPSSTHVDARILVASSSGRVELYKWSSNSTSEDDTLKLVTRLESSPKEGSEGNDMIEYTSGCMHPDGFIYIAGTSDGSLIVWDLKSQAVAGTLKVSSRQLCPLLHNIVMII